MCRKWMPRSRSACLSAQSDQDIPCPLTKGIFWCIAKSLLFETYGDESVNIRLRSTASLTVICRTISKLTLDLTPLIGECIFWFSERRSLAFRIFGLRCSNSDHWRAHAGRSRTVNAILTGSWLRRTDSDHWRTDAGLSRIVNTILTGSWLRRTNSENGRTCTGTTRGNKR